MQPSPYTLAALSLTLVLQLAHLGMHVAVYRGRSYPSLPLHDAIVGYAGAAAWFAMVLLDRGTLGLSPVMAVPLGAVLFGLGLIVHSLGIRDLRRYRDQAHLVTQGIYGRLRHPVYYGWAVASFGAPLLFLSAVGLLTAPIWSAIILLCGPMEERILRRTLPPGEYDSYARTTWF